MALLGSAVYKLKTDNQGFNKGLASAEKKSGESMKRISQSMQKVGIGMVAAGAAVLAPLGLAIGQASKLEESINAVNVVFGKGADSILEFSKTASRSVGLASSEFNQLSAVSGALFNGMAISEEEAAQKTIELAKRAADLASVFDTSVADALEALNAGLRGETEPLRRFAADVTDATLQAHLMAQGIDRKVSSMSQAEKGLLRFEVAMAQTAKVEGDWLKTRGSFANRMRESQAILKDGAAIIGGHLLPVMADLLGAVSGLMAKVSEWTTKHPKLTKVLVLGAAVVGALLLVMGGLLIAMSMIISLAPAMGVAMSVAFGPIGLIITAVGLLIAAGILLWKNWDKIWQFIGQTVEDVVNFVIRAFNTLTLGYRKVLGGLGKAAGWVAGVFGKELPGGMKKFMDAVDAGIPEVNIFTKQLASSVEASGDLTDAMTAAKDSLENYTKPLSDVVRTSKALAEADQAQAAARDNLNDLIESGTASTEELTDAQALWESATDRVTAAEKEAKDALAKRGNEQKKVAKEAQEIRETILEQIADYTDQRTEIESEGLQARRDAQEDHLDDLQGIQESYDEDVKDTRERLLDDLQGIQASYDDDVEDAQESHLDDLQDIQESYDDDVEDTQERHLDTLQGIQVSYDDDVQDAQERHLDTLQDIQASYDDDVEDAQERHLDTLQGIQASYEMT